MLQNVAMWTRTFVLNCSMLQYFIMLQYVAVCCSIDAVFRVKSTVVWLSCFGALVHMKSRYQSSYNHGQFLTGNTGARHGGLRQSKGY